MLLSRFRHIRYNKFDCLFTLLLCTLTIANLNSQSNFTDISDPLLINSPNFRTNLSVQSITNYKKAENENSLFTKLMVGSAFSFAYDVTIGTILYSLPCEYTNWEKNNNFHEGPVSAFQTPPKWDSDPWYINYVGHPYQGGFYYNSVRTQGIGILGSAMFTCFQTVVWEYAIECKYETPSINDLICTPVLGSIFGEASYRLTILFKRNGFNTIEKILVIVLNPNYALQKGFSDKKSRKK
ncbi:MAG: hypothetical protein C0598_03635 [Marinilabiliales bacterium]|nr:MAG: hypothetical protein C0598_03635 [Marinilabiliales bacterium]